MPVPYRKSRVSNKGGSAAYLEVIWIRATLTLYGALFLTDVRGQPIEFVHNNVATPSGFLWPEDRVRALGTVTLAHSLFDACEREPDLLICRETLGKPEFCKTEISPSIPFAQVSPGFDGAPIAWNWINNAPTTDMTGYALAQELMRRDQTFEPFERIGVGLKEVYPDVPWEEAFR